MLEPLPRCLGIRFGFHYGMVAPGENTEFQRPTNLGPRAAAQIVF